MDSPTQVPLWLALAIGLGTPVLAFAGALIGQVLARKGAREQETRWRREETMRMLRWAAELAIESETGRSDLGVAALGALQSSVMLQVEDQSLISAVLDTVVEPVADNYDEGDVVEEAK